MDTIHDLIDKITREDGDRLAYILGTCSNLRNVANLDAKEIEKNFKIYQNSDILNIILSYVKLNKAINNYDVIESFNTCNELLKNLNRFAEQKTVWIVKSLISVTKNLIKYATKADEYIGKNSTLFITKMTTTTTTTTATQLGEFEQEKCTIKAARTIHNSFKLCLNDRNEIKYESRRNSVYFFVGQELKIYFKLQNRDLAKNMEKVLISKSKDLPLLSKIDKSHAITYLYYSGAITCDEGDFKTAYNKFKYAYQLCLKNDLKHKESILIYLIPLNFLITKKYPNLIKLKNFKINYDIYKPILQSLLNGDLKTFDKIITKYEFFFVKKNLYLVIENLRIFIILKLLMKIYRLNGNNSHLQIKKIARGFEFSINHTNNENLNFKNKTISIFSTDETECILANLIYNGYIKGYLSHTNGVLVLSKKDPFPKQVKKDV